MENAARRLYVWGSGGAGQLGLGDTDDYALPQRFTNDSQILLESVTSGGCHSAGATANGELFVWGENEKSQLGVDVKESSEATKPTSLANLGVVSARLVACGWSHTIAVCTQQQHGGDDGEVQAGEGDRVFSWGASGHFQLGRPTSSREQAFTPTVIPEFRVSGRLCVKSIACGWKHSLLATEGGEVFAWGSGRNGELGLGDAVLAADRPTKVNTFQEDTGIGVHIDKVLCGWQHSALHASGGELFTCGSNRHGQLGLRDAAQAPVTSKVNGVPRKVKDASGAADLLVSQVDVGWHFVLCLTVEASGTTELVSWGKGSHGQLGHGNFASVAVPTAIPFHNPSGIRSIACGSEHSLVITNDGELSSCGWGEHGNLGHGDQENRCELEKVAFFEENRLEVRSIVAGGAVSIALATPMYL